MEFDKDFILELVNSPLMKDDFWIFNYSGSADKVEKPDHLSTIMKVQKALETNAVWLRGVENFSEEIKNHCKKMGAVNCHVILAPRGSTILNRHTDPWTVIAHVIYGQRRYKNYGYENKNLVLDDLVEAGRVVAIPEGTHHEVSCPVDSVTINFGIGQQDFVEEPLKNQEPPITGLFDTQPFFKRWE